VVEVGTRREVVFIMTSIGSTNMFGPVLEGLVLSVLSEVRERRGWKGSGMRRAIKYCVHQAPGLFLPFSDKTSSMWYLALAA
jgi:hypothetical protein